jgi:hypothetical protein
MVEFKALKLVEYEDLVGAVSTRLKDGFDWFFTPEFKALKGDFMTGDFKGQLVRKRGQLPKGDEEAKKHDNKNMEEYYG